MQRSANMSTKLLNYFVGLAFISLVLILGFWVERGDFLSLQLLYLGCFALYLFAYRNAQSPHDVNLFIGVAIVARLLLIGSFPNLSDDIYRFFWDGKLWHAGINPFDALPSHYAEQGFPKGLNQTLYDQLNSPNYFTIYPPIAQFIYYIATFTSDVYRSAIVMKLFLFAAEVGSIWLLIRLIKHQGMEEKSVLLYVLNPLIVVELMGNLHFEGVMIFFVLLSYWWLQKGWQRLSAVAFAFSVATKLLPLIFLPFLIHKLGWKKSLQYFVIVGVVTVALFWPLFGSFFIENFGKSLNLYFQKFEFNASLYYVFRWLGYQVYGYNLISVFGPLLALMAGTIIFAKAIQEKSKGLKNLPEQWLWAIIIYLLCTTTVHPWYITLPILLSIFTNYRFPIVWSALIFLTYVNYSYEPYFENLWVVALEYSLVLAYLIHELRLNRRFQ